MTTYFKEGTVQLTSELSLTNFYWTIHAVHDIPNEKYCTIAVKFWNEGVTLNHARNMLEHEYKETWEDADLYSALLELPQFEGSKEI